MPMVDVTDVFCMDPEGFMRQNIILQKITRTEPGVVNVRVLADSDSKIGNVPGDKVCVMALAKPGVRPALPAYWCPYEQNTLKTAMLGDDALYAFTPTMDGCSIGLGSPSASGAQLIAHVNASQIGKDWEPDVGMNAARQRQAQSQHNQLRQALGGAATIVNPEDYRLDGTGTHSMSSTTYGVHALGRPWKLHTLTYRRMGEKSWFHGGVTGR